MDTTEQNTDPVDDGRRYLLSVPRGHTPVLDALSAADHHTIAVYGSADLASRLDDANQHGMCVAWRQWEPDNTDGM